MGLDYTSGCVNFRDVAEYINLISGKTILRKNCFYRGGKIDHVETLSDIGSPSTIINLRKGFDPEVEGVHIEHFPISNDYEKYDTADKMVRRWLNDIISYFASDTFKCPFLIHCTSGKDRTGVVVAAILKILDIPDNIIIEEYLLSDGEVEKEWIEQSLDGIGDPKQYFNRVHNIENISKLFKLNDK